MKGHRSLALLTAAIVLCALPARAAVMHGRAWEATYVAAFQPTFGPSRVPYSGTMSLKFNQGIVSGTYVSDSVRPDPLRGRTVPVSGNVSEGRITLIFQSPANFTIRGTIAGDGQISGSGSIRGTTYSLLAKVKSSP
ncbi:MAG: hypothetical protein WCC84_06310 [Candidatus Cybelea sp.]